MHLVSVLTESRNADGGWGYAPGRQSRLEPTALALAALAAAGEADVDLSVWTRWPSRDGLLLDPVAGTVNAGFNGQVLLSRVACGDRAAGVAGLVAGLERLKGRTLPQNDVIRQNNQLQAWPWLDDTFSWAEPTAWCTLALKAWTRAHGGSDAVRARLDEAERLMRDRMCDGGGWNYGNAQVYGQALDAFVPTTALGLLAMQDRPSDPAVEKSLAWLVAHRLDERSTLALSLASIALAAFGRDRADVNAALVEALDAHGDLTGLHAKALALIALSGEALGSWKLSA